MSNIVESSSFHPIAGWNEYVKGHYSIAQKYIVVVEIS